MKLVKIHHFQSSFLEMEGEVGEEDDIEGREGRRNRRAA